MASKDEIDPAFVEHMLAIDIHPHGRSLGDQLAMVGECLNSDVPSEDEEDVPRQGLAEGGERDSTEEPPLGLSADAVSSSAPHPKPSPVLLCGPPQVPVLGAPWYSSWYSSLELGRPVIFFLVISSIPITASLLSQSIVHIAQLVMLSTFVIGLYNASMFRVLRRQPCVLAALCLAMIMALLAIGFHLMKSVEIPEPALDADEASEHASELFENSFGVWEAAESVVDTGYTPAVEMVDGTVEGSRNAIWVQKLVVFGMVAMVAMISMAARSRGEGKA